jgi:C-terminal processing protease CtpA/Prc
MQTLSKETDALILDLRGNNGGMSDNIRWLASFLYGNSAKMADEIIHERKSAAVYALLHNETAFDIIDAMEHKQSAQDYLLRNKNELLEEFRRLENKKPSWSRQVRQGSKSDFNQAKGYDKPIRILIDQGCASACEGGFARFLSHPKVKTYGTNTVGAAHYGDTEPLVLPNSGVIVSIPTTYREFSDGRFIEKIGYAPDVTVMNGSNAFEEALKELTETLI